MSRYHPYSGDRNTGYRSLLHPTFQNRARSSFQSPKYRRITYDDRHGMIRKMSYVKTIGKKDFGFISPDIFFHFSAVRNIELLRIGQTVEYYDGYFHGRPCAVDIRIIENDRQSEQVSCEKNDGSMARANFEIPKLRSVFEGRYVIIKSLGKGRYGQIFEAFDIEKYNQSGIFIVAIKFANTESYIDDLKKEYEILSLNSKATPKVYGFKKNYLVMEMVQGQNLYEYQSISKVGKVQFFRIARNCMKKLEELHRFGIVHCDIRPANIMIDNCDKIQFIDFGTSFSRCDSKPTNKCFTSNYASIDMHGGTGKSRCICPIDDVWMMFYVLFEMANGSLPWREVPKDLEWSIRNKEKRKMKEEQLIRLEFSHGVSDEVKSALTDMKCILEKAENKISWNEHEAVIELFKSERIEESEDEVDYSD